MVTEEDAIWAQILKAKYLAFVNFWNTSRIEPCTRLWKAMMNNRAIMANNTRWVIEDGRKCHIFGQPWFNNWQTIVQNERSQSQLKVRYLFNYTNQAWDRSRQVEVFGQQTASQFEEEFRNKILYPGIEDKLMFTWARNGEFSVKRAYEMIYQLQPLERFVQDENSRLLYKKIWYTKGILPKIRVFFWKVLNRGLPTSVEMARRF